MRLTVTDNGRGVDIRIKGRSPELLARAEATALRLLAAVPEEAEEERPPIGFAPPASASTERAKADDDQADAE